MSTPHIALIEIGGSHDECLLTQMKALRDRDQTILLITSQEIWDRNPVFADYVDEFFAADRSRADVKKIWSKLKSSGIKKAVINTAQGNAIRSLCLKALFHPIEFIGIIHTTRMFTESFTHKIIARKIKKFLLLSDYLLHSVPAQRGSQLEYFYPIDFPSKPVDVEKTKRVVAIVGGVEPRRKDLDGFFKILEAAPDDMRFVFLGKSDPNNEDVRHFLTALQEKEQTERVKTFDAFVSQSDFDFWLQQADFILPLIHPNTPSADQYFRNQISGAMMVALGYTTPLLMHEAYAHWTELKPAAIYYSLDSIGAQLRTASSELEARRALLKQTVSAADQQERYARFVLG